MAKNAKIKSYLHVPETAPDIEVDPTDVTVVTRKFPNGSGYTTEIPNDMYDEMMKRVLDTCDPEAVSAAMDKFGILPDSPPVVKQDDTVIADTRSMTNNFNTINDRRKSYANDPVDPIVIDWTKGQCKQYDEVLVDKAYMMTGYPCAPNVPVNILCDNENGRIYAEAPDANDKCWHGTLDRPCFIGTTECCYGIFVPFSCNAQSLRQVAKSLYDVSNNALDAMELPFMKSYLMDK